MAKNAEKMVNSWIKRRQKNRSIDITVNLAGFVRHIIKCTMPIFAKSYEMIISREKMSRLGAQGYDDEGCCLC